MHQYNKPLYKDQLFIYFCSIALLLILNDPYFQFIILSISICILCIYETSVFYKDLNKKPQQTFKKKLSREKPIKLSISLKKPELFVSSMISFTFGGLLGYSFLENNIIIFSLTGITLTIISNGLVLLLSELGPKQKEKLLIKNQIKKILSHKTCHFIIASVVIGIIISSQYYSEKFTDSIPIIGLVFIICYGLYLMTQEEKSMPQKRKKTT